MDSEVRVCMPHKEMPYRGTLPYLYTALASSLPSYPNFNPPSVEVNARCVCDCVSQ
jgi:hypothetical protein